MRRLICCEYHEDSESVELRYTDGTLIDIDCMAVEELNAIKFKKKREVYAQEHDCELRLFHLAKRKLDKAASDHKIPVLAWKKELAELSKSYARESAELKPIRDELKELYKLKSKLNAVLREQDQNTKEKER